jgi:hypothetical protein
MSHSRLVGIVVQCRDIAMVETLSNNFVLLCNETISRTTLLQNFRRVKVTERAMSRFAVDTN